ncbi:hypothetical protein MPER_09955, partial [Moniliophthora perniciosa FA553]
TRILIFSAPPPPGDENPEIVVPPAAVWGQPEGLVPPTRSKVEQTALMESRCMLLVPSYMGGLRELNLIILPTRADLKHFSLANTNPGYMDGQSVHISYDGKEILIQDEFEILVGSQSAIQWTLIIGKFSLDQLNDATPIPGGYNQRIRDCWLGDQCSHC